MRLARTPSADDSGRLPLWPPLLSTRGSGAASGMHAHHAMHIVLSEAGDLRVRGGEHAWRGAAGVVTAPDVEHAIDARGKDVLLVFLDPESVAGASLLAVLGGPVRLVADAERKALLDAAHSRELLGPAGAEWMGLAVSVLGGGALAAKRSVHPRVRKLLAHLRALPPEADTSLDALAAAVGLSPGRLMHAFTESIGVPVRPYLQWLKLQRAAAAIVGGLPLAQAAQAAGFADAAHMSRTFRRMLGTPPSALRRPEE